MRRFPTLDADMIVSLRSFAFLAVSLVGAFVVGAAEAATWRYSFDIVHDELGFDEVFSYTLDSSGATVDGPFGVPAEKQEQLVAALHPMRSMIGARGQVVIDVTLARELLPHETAVEATIACVSGALCSSGLRLGDGHFSASGPLGLSADLGMYLYLLFDGVNGSSAALKLPAWTYSGGGGQIYEPGFSYGAALPYANFDLANVSRVRLSEVPLPASGALLGAVFVAAPFLRRRRAAKSA